MRQIIRLLPSSALAKVLAGYLGYISEPILDEEQNEEETEEKPIQDDEDPFDSIMVNRPPFLRLIFFPIFFPECLLGFSRQDIDLSYR